MSKIVTVDGISRCSQENGRMIAWSVASGVNLIQEGTYYFKDLERTGNLLPYEDWRLEPWERAKDLAKRLSIEEIAGLMLYSPHQMVPPQKEFPFVGTYNGKSFEDAGKAAFDLSDEQKVYLEQEHIRHILLFAVEDAAVSAKWSNELQKKAESLPHGIPVNISSDPRNGAKSSGAEFSSCGSDVSKWPEGMGFAACFDESVVRQFAEDASKEYRALGITTALGPQIDLSTEPRWMRFADTLGMDTEMSIAMTKAYCDGMQTTKGEADGWGRDSVNTMVKHWPGGGTGEGGRDAHYPFGAYAVYPSHNFKEHLKPFTEGAFQLEGATQKAAAVMPYYTISWEIDQKNGKNVGNSYSEYIIKDLLREKYNYEGVVCTDWGITQEAAASMDSFGSRCYGVEEWSEAQRCLVIIMNGVDQFGGNCESAPIIEAYQIGCKQYGENVMREKMELSAARLLKNIFQCGLFEDPYLEPGHSAKVVGCKTFFDHGYEAQKKSVVLVKNRKEDSSNDAVLPLKKGIRVYVPERYVQKSKGFFRQDIPEHREMPVTEEIMNPYATLVNNPEDADIAIVFVESPQCNPYQIEDVESGGNGYYPISLQYRPYTAEYARKESIAGGDFREKMTNRSYYGKTNTTYNEQDLDNILMCRKKMGNKPVIVCATLSNPMIVSEFEPEVDAIIMEFGVSKRAVLEVLFGEFNPSGRLPIQIPQTMRTVEEHSEDRAHDLTAYRDSEGNVYEYSFGMSYRV